MLSLSFSVSLAHVFPVEQQLMAVSQLLAYIISLPIEKPSCELEKRDGESHGVAGRGTRGREAGGSH